MECKWKGCRGQNRSAEQQLPTATASVEARLKVYAEADKRPSTDAIAKAMAAQGYGD